MSEFVLNMTGLFLSMTELVRDNTLFALSIIKFVLNLTGLFLNITEYITFSNYDLISLKYYLIFPKYECIGLKLDYICVTTMI